MTLMRMPVFVWMTLIVSFLIILRLPCPITVAITLLLFDRMIRARTSSLSTAGAERDPLLWQHLFWIFGHPEVYILILPAMGIVSDILPYLLAEAALRLHDRRLRRRGHRLPRLRRLGAPHVHRWPRPNGPPATFAIATMAIVAVPTGVKIFNWLATTLGRLHVSFKTPMLFALGFISHVHARRIQRRDARIAVPVDAPAARHLLHRRPLPLRPLRRQPSSGLWAASISGSPRSPAAC